MTFFFSIILCHSHGVHNYALEFVEVNAWPFVCYNNWKEGCRLNRMSELSEGISKIVGPERVLSRPSQLNCYARDFYPGPDYLPDLVVVPDSVEQVAPIVRLAYQMEIPLTPRGKGTSVTGSSLPVRGGLVLDLSDLRRVLELDGDNLVAVLEPGVVWGDLSRLLEQNGMFTPSVPGSGRVSTVGGAVASGGSGSRALKYGPTRDQVLGLKAVLPGGEDVALGGRLTKTACGYDLKNLLIGSEGTLGVITEITLRVWPLPPATLVAVLDLENLDVAMSLLSGLRRAGVIPSAFEITPASTLLPAGEECTRRFQLVVEFKGPDFEIEYAESLLWELHDTDWRMLRRREERDRLWRRAGEVYFSLIRKCSTPVAEDLGVPVSEVPKALDTIETLLESMGVRAGLFCHAGDGTIHCVLTADRNDPEAWETMLTARENMHRIVIGLGGTVTAEHGLGMYRARLAEAQLGTALKVMQNIKQALDPAGLMNPGKMGLYRG